MYSTTLSFAGIADRCRTALIRIRLELRMSARNPNKPLGAFKLHRLPLRSESQLRLTESAHVQIGPPAAEDKTETSSDESFGQSLMVNPDYFDSDHGELRSLAGIRFSGSRRSDAGDLGFGRLRSFLQVRVIHLHQLRWIDLDLLTATWISNYRVGILPIPNRPSGRRLTN